MAHPDGTHCYVRNSRVNDALRQGYTLGHKSAGDDDTASDMGASDVSPDSISAQDEMDVQNDLSAQSGTFNVADPKDGDMTDALSGWFTPAVDLSSQSGEQGDAPALYPNSLTEASRGVSTDDQQDSAVSASAPAWLSGEYDYDPFDTNYQGQDVSQSSTDSVIADPNPIRITVIDGPKSQAAGQPVQGAVKGEPRNDLMDNPDVEREAYKLFEESAYGNAPTEHAMWVTFQNGHYGFVRWPWTAQQAKETWRGPLPPGVIGQIHTHPTRMSEKPDNDKDRGLANGQQTNGLRMPVCVLHRRGIWKAVPGVKDPIQVRDYHWIDEFKR